MSENKLLLIVIVYTACMLNVICHEISHAISCKTMGRKISGIRIGSGPALKIGDCSVCPIPIGGSVGFNTDGLGKGAKRIIFLSGPFVSVAMFIISAVFTYPGHIIVEVHAVLMIALSMIGSDSDLYKAFH